MKVFAVLFSIVTLSLAQKPSSKDVSSLLEKLFTSNPAAFPPRMQSTSPIPPSSPTENCTATNPCYPASRSQDIKTNNCKLTDSCPPENTDRINFNNPKIEKTNSNNFNPTIEKTSAIIRSSSVSKSSNTESKVKDCELDNSCEDFSTLNAGDAKDAVKSIFDCVLKNSCDFQATENMAAKMSEETRSNLEIRINSAIDCVLSNSCEFKERNIETENLQESTQSSINNNNGGINFNNNDSEFPDCVLAGNCDNLKKFNTRSDTKNRFNSFVSTNNNNNNNAVVHQNELNTNSNNNNMCGVTSRNSEIIQTDVDFQQVRNVLYCILTNTCNFHNSVESTSSSNSNNNFNGNSRITNQGMQVNRNGGSQGNRDLDCILYNICNSSNNNKENTQRIDSLIRRRIMAGNFVNSRSSLPSNKPQKGFYN